MEPPRGTAGGRAQARRPFADGLGRLLSASGLRLALLYALVFVLSSTLLFGVVHWATVGALRQEIGGEVQADLAELLRAAPGEAATAERLAQALSAAHAATHAARSGTRHAVLDNAGRRLAGDLPAIRPDSTAGWFETQGEGGEPALLGQAVALPGGGTLVAARDATRLDETADLIETAFLWAGGATLLLGLAGGLVVARGFLRRVDAIAATAEAIARGELGRRVPGAVTPGSRDEMDRLAAAINAMLDRIHALMEELRHATSAIAHDLRTPLARLRQGLEQALAGAATAAEYEAAVTAAIAETDAILRSFAALLRIAQIESGSRRAGFAAVDLSAVAAAVAEAYGPSVEDSGRRIETAIAPGVQVRGDRELLTQMLANLVENAIRHTPPGTRLALHLSATAAEAVLAVEDDGEGIPASEREHVLRRFHRLDPSRSADGSGLGLALVAVVAELHEAQLRLGAALPGGRGLRVALRFCRLAGTMPDGPREAQRRILDG